MKPSCIHASEHEQAHLDHKGPVAQQFDGLRGKHEQTTGARQRKAQSCQPQRQPCQGLHGQLAPQAPDPHLQQHQIAQEQANADDVQHFQRGVSQGMSDDPAEHEAIVAGKAALRRGTLL